MPGLVGNSRRDVLSCRGSILILGTENRRNFNNCEVGISMIRTVYMHKKYIFSFALNDPK